MTLTSNEAKLLLSSAEPYEQRVQIPDGAFQQMGIPMDVLKAQSFYRGTELAGSDSVVHVLERSGLEKASGARWADYQTSRQARRFVALADRGR